ncbi:MAG: HAD family hydrolase [Candidatus Melainabacteria bacterium]|nr:HAD family hydrolase [Candidatus Melainabacteria bacterium]
MSEIKVVLVDLWRTLGYSHPREPIHDVQRILGHKVTERDGKLEIDEDPDFLRDCLTMDIRQPGAFLATIGRVYGRSVPEGGITAFRALLAQEKKAFTIYPDTLPMLSGLAKKHVRVGLVSNLWSFPTRHIFQQRGLGRFFEHKIYSFEVGLKKPEPEIFELAAKRFGVRPENCLMVGDDPQNDVAGALAAGMKAALINRERRQVALPDGVMNLGSLTGLLESLTPSRKAA